MIKAIQLLTFKSANKKQLPSQTPQSKYIQDNFEQLNKKWSTVSTNIGLGFGIINELMGKNKSILKGILVGVVVWMCGIVYDGYKNTNQNTVKVIAKKLIDIRYQNNNNDIIAINYGLKDDLAKQALEILKTINF